MTQVTLVTLTLLIPHPYNPLTSRSSHNPSLNVVPQKYYDYPGAYDGDGVYGGVSTAGALLRSRENATFVMLSRNSDINGAVQSVSEMEMRFNHKYGYPWVFLNDEPFSDDFKKCVPTRFLF
jgi:alpha 1,2-mannosyltransferase